MADGGGAAETFGSSAWSSRAATGRAPGRIASKIVSIAVGTATGSASARPGVIRTLVEIEGDAGTSLEAGLAGAATDATGAAVMPANGSATSALVLVMI